MSTTKKSGSDGFSEAERAAIKERAQELKACSRSSNGPLRSRRRSWRSSRLRSPDDLSIEVPDCASPDA